MDPKSPRAIIRQARVNRHAPTPAERRLWECLRKDGLDGYGFRRQLRFSNDEVLKDMERVLTAILHSLHQVPKSE